MLLRLLLQSLQPRLQLGLLLAPPLTLQIKVAQHQCRHDETDQRMAQVTARTAAVDLAGDERKVLGQGGADQRQADHQSAT